MQNDPQSTPPGLYIVGTPIGNLEDMSFRGVRTLKEVDFILAEDTRKTGILLQHYGISKPMHSCHEFNEASRAARVVEEIKAGRAVALVSDAGMPLISDPGARVVKAVRAAELLITSIPGPTALTTALALSGWGGDGFVFAGFPPNKSAGRRRMLEQFRDETRPVILYESTHRIEKLLADIAELLGERPVFMARELSKKFETLKMGTAADLSEFLKTHSSKGEFVVILSGSAGVSPASGSAGVSPASGSAGVSPASGSPGVSPAPHHQRTGCPRSRAEDQGHSSGL